MRISTARLGRSSVMMRVTATLLALLMVATACAAPADEGEAEIGDFGAEGKPIDLVVGYQPYYTQSWTGVIMRDQNLWEKYLPEGSTVTWQIGLQGAVVVSQMLGRKQHIGYVGDMPGLVATSRRDQEDIRIVSNLGLSWDQCNVFLVRPDAPEFDTAKEAAQWMNGQVVATPQGSCTDRFAQKAFADEAVEPGQYLNQSIEVIASNFDIGRIDAAAIWEPSASQFENKGLARRVATGNTHGVNDGGFMIMLNDLIEQRPDVVEAWMRAELDAQEYWTDPANHMEVARAAEEQTEGFSRKDLWDSLYKRRPEEQGGHPDNIKMIAPFIVDDQVQDLIDDAWTFLHDIKTIPHEEPLDDIVRDEFARAVLKESGLKYPKKILGLPEGDFKG